MSSAGVEEEEYEGFEEFAERCRAGETVSSSLLDGRRTVDVVEGECGIARTTMARRATLEDRNL